MHNFANRKILVVDDMKSMRSLIKACLTDMGVQEIAEAADGKSALGLLRTKRFDLTICDWDMPVMDGLELLKIVRADERLNPMRFLMLTANVHASKVGAAISAGVNDYIAKPFKPETLQTKVTRLLTVKAAA